MKKWGRAMANKRISKPALVFSGLGIGLFLTLMIYAMTHDPNALPSQLVGQSFPNFKANLNPVGEMELAQMAGKNRWTVINFWNTTCVVCREEAPELERMYQTSLQENSSTPDGTKFPIFVSVNIQDTAEAIEAYKRNFNLTYPVVSDKVGKISLDYGVTGTPETFFIDPKGIVRHRVAGAVDLVGLTRFVDWLEKNPNTTSAQAMEGFLKVRM
jgi:cytochrome c biogenesis protein CcmG, thiol:disulfide interchange protein DsbE